MKRLLFLFAVTVIFSSTFVFAQEQDDEPLPPKRLAAKLGGAGGFTTSWLFMDVDPINQLLIKNSAQELSKGGMPLYGGQGYAYLMLMNNFRIGGMGVSGTRKTNSIEPATNIRRDVELTVGYGGVTADYVIPLSSRLDLTLGMFLGSGGLDFKITKDNGSNVVWDSLWTNYGSSDSIQNYSQKLSGSFFIYQPSVNLEYALMRWFGVRLGASYMGMSGGSWKLDDKYDIVNVPDNINGKGWMINTGVFIGTFMF